MRPAGETSAFSAALDFGLRVVPGGGQASATRLNTIRMYQPTGLFLTPSHCFRLINVALEEGISLPDFGVAKIVLAGEPGGSNERIRTRLADAWHCEIFDHYGSTEACPCGSHHARCLGGILGRRADMVVVKGTNVFPGAIEAIVREYPEIVEFQCLARLDLEDPELALQIEVQRDHEAIVASLARDIKDILHLSARVQVVPPGTLPQFEGKARRFRRASPGPAALPLDPAAHRAATVAGGSGAPPAKG